MARITVEDCLKKIDSQYDLVLLAKERTSQLNAGDPSLVPQDNDKNKWEVFHSKACRLANCGYTKQSIRDRTIG